MKNTRANIQQAGYPKLSQCAPSRSQIPTIISSSSAIAAGSLHIGSVIDGPCKHIPLSLSGIKGFIGGFNVVNGAQAIIANNSSGNLPKSQAECTNQNIASISNLASGVVLLAEAFTGGDIVLINETITNTVKVAVSTTQIISNMNQGSYELKRQNQSKMKK